MEYHHQIRVFISSPFSDFQIERQALQERVFPRVRDYCEALGWRFQAIDLRWGVSQEAGLDQRTMRICLDEIERCRTISPRPNLIVLLGDRYGWRPLPEEIPAFEFDEIRRWIEPAELDLMEWRADQTLDAKGWYRRDDNALVRRPGGRFEPGMYLLQPRSGPFENFDFWESRVEKPLLQALVSASRTMKLSEAARIKYGASATEQEIYYGAFRDPQAAEHVLAFHRTLVDEKGRPWFETGEHPGRGGPDAGWRNMFDADEEGCPDWEAARRVGDLKARLREHIGPESVYEYEAVWDRDKLRTDWLEPFCREVEKRLESSIQSRIDRYEEISPNLRGSRTHQAVGRELGSSFVGRENHLERLDRYLTSVSPTGPLAVMGAEGCGKSALLAAGAESLRRRHPRTFVVERFIGATPESTLLTALLEDLCDEIGAHYGESQAPVSGVHEAVRLLAQRLALADSARSLALFIDGVDQIQVPEAIHPLQWLPDHLPGGVRIVVSFDRGGQSAAGRQPSPYASRFDDDFRIVLGGFNADEAVAALNLHLSGQVRSIAAGSYDTQRNLSAEQKRALLDLFGYETSPLFHRLVSETARLWPSWESAPVLPGSVEGMVKALLDEWSTPARHGRVLVQSVCGYLQASRHGLSEEELLDLLSRDDAVWQDFLARSRHHLGRERRLPAVVFLRLRHDLERLLVSRSVRGGTTLGFSGRKLAAAGLADESPEERRAQHASLAAYFRSRPWRRESAADLRNLSERCFHLQKAGQWKELEETLFDFDYIECFCESFDTAYKAGCPVDYRGVHFLMGDLAETLNEAGLPAGLRSKLVALRNALQAAIPTTRLFPNGVAQQVFNHLATYSNGTESERFIAAAAEKQLRQSGRLWFRALPPESGLNSVGRRPDLFSTSGDFDLIACGPGARFFCLETRSDLSFALMIWDVDERRPVWIIEDRPPTELRQAPVAARWLKAENKIAFVRGNGEICLADPKLRRVETIWSFGRVATRALIHDSGWCVLCDDESGSVQIEAFAPAGGRVMAFELPSTGRVAAMALSPAADRLFLALDSGPGQRHKEIYQVEIPKGPFELLVRLDLNSGITALTADDGSRLLAVGTSAGGVWIVDAVGREVQSGIPGWAEQRLAGWKRESWSLGTADGRDGQPALREKVSMLAFTADGRRVLAASCPPARRCAPGVLLTLDVETGKAAGLDEYFSGINSFGFLPGRNRLIVAGYETLFSIDPDIQADSGPGPVRDTPFGDTMECAAVAPDCRQAALSFSGVIHVVAAQNREGRLKIPSGAGYLKSLDWIGPNLWSLGADGRIHVWDASTGVALAVYPAGAEPRLSYSCFSAPLRNQSMCLAGRGEELILFKDDGTAAARNLGYEISCLGLSPDGDVAVAALEDSICFAFSTRTWEPLGGIEGHCSVSSVILLDEATALTLYSDGSSVLWKTDTGQELERFALPDITRFTAQGYLVDGRFACAVGRDDVFFITVHGDDTCRAWRKGRPHPAGELPLNPGAQAARVSPSGEDLFIVDANGVLRSYKIES